MRKNVFLSLIVLNISVLFGQNEVDVLRFSDTDIFGSARYEAMAGSFGGLGADFSVIQFNPAGLARFASSQFVVSSNNTFINTTGIYNNTSSEITTSSYKLGTVGLVITRDISNENSGWTYRQFSFGYTRIKNFDGKRRYEGQNFNSLLDVFAAEGAGIPENPSGQGVSIYNERPFTTGLAMDAQTIGYDENTVSYFPLLTAGDMYHERTISTSGGIGEFHFGFSQNYMNQLYIGASVSARRAVYTERIDHREELLEPDGVTLNAFDYTYDLETKGWGFNVKAGLIYLPDDLFRLGLAFETRTQLTLEDNYQANMIGYHDFGTTPVPQEFIPFGEYKYRIRTPSKLKGSIAYIFDYRGAINFDLELINFRSGLLSPDPSGEYGFYPFTVENQEVNNQYRMTLNTRIGVEYMVIQNIFVRGGYALIPQAFKREVSITGTPRQTFAGGIGYNGKKIMADISFRAVNGEFDYFAFDPTQDQNRTQFTEWMNTIVLSLSFKF